MTRGIRLYGKMLILLFWLIAGWNNTQIQGQELLPEEDLQLDWIFYENPESVPLPFLANRNAAPHAIHLQCNINRGKAAYLMMVVPSATSVLIENKFMEYVKEEAPIYWSADSLRQIYKSDDITITLFRNKKFQETVEAAIGYKYQRPEEGLAINPMVERQNDGRADYFKILLLLVFCFFVILYSIFPAELFEFYSINSVIAYRMNDTLLSRFRSVTKIQVLIIIFEAALMAALMMIVLNYYNNPLGNLFFLSWNPVFGWFILFGITFIALWLKYIVILFFSMLFNVFERANLYFIEYNRITLLFYSIIFLIVAYCFINYLHGLTSLISGLMVIILIFYFIRMAILYFKLHNTVSINNLHLFSYLCATELVPVIIGLNFFLG